MKRVSYDEVYDNLLKVHEKAQLKNTQKLRLHYETEADKRIGWRLNRQIYIEWRTSEAGTKWVEKKRRKQLNRCFICVQKLGGGINVDHIIPLYNGGTNNRRNLCITHPACNMLKGTSESMTYKQACARRKLFKQLARAKAIYAEQLEKPDMKLSKKQQRCVDIAYKYLDAYEFYSPE